MTDLDISPEFMGRIKEAHGSKGNAWLSELPRLIAEYTDQWKLSQIQPIPNLAYNFVARGVDSTGTQVIIKLGVPGPELQSEIEALKVFRGNGSVKLLQHSPQNDAMLLEDIEPGNSIQELTLNGKDDEAVLVACGIISKLHATFSSPASPSYRFRTVEDWGEGFRQLRKAFQGGTGPFNSRMICRAESQYQEMLNTTQKMTLLHGDLHHGNILTATREPGLAIDPKGILGDPAYEVGAFIRNPIPDLMALPHIKNVLRNRIDLFSENLGFEKHRVWAWSFSQLVLAAWWLFEDSQPGWEPWMELAEVVWELK